MPPLQSEYQCNLVQSLVGQRLQQISRNGAMLVFHSHAMFLKLIVKHCFSQDLKGKNNQIFLIRVRANLILGSWNGLNIKVPNKVFIKRILKKDIKKAHHICEGSLYVAQKQSNESSGKAHYGQQWPWYQSS